MFDLKYYEDELNYYEHFYMGDLQIANLKMSKKFVKCQDRLSTLKVKNPCESFTYMTRVVDTEKDPIATIAMVHGFCESSNSTFLEAAFHHALNGFEVVMVDMKGFGYASGARCT